MDKNVLTWDDVDDKLENLGWTVQDHQGNGDVYQIGIYRYSPAGQECDFTLQCMRNNPASVVEAFEELYNNYDVDYEASLWIGPDGHGKDGAPYHITDIVKDLEAVDSELSESWAKLESFCRNFEFVYHKEEMAELFAETISGIYGSGPVEEKHAINLCKQAVKEIVNTNRGSPEQKKKVLSEYLKEIGITDDKPETYANSLNKVKLVHNHKALLFKLRNQTKSGTLNTVTPSMEEQDEKIHKMFDFLFCQSDTNPVDYADYVISAGNGATVNGLTGDRWWKSAVDHAVNSGGSLWQDTAERIRLFDKFGLLEESITLPCYQEYKNYMLKYGNMKDLTDFEEFKKNIYPNKADMTEYLQGKPQLLKKYKNFEDHLFDKYCDKADKMYGQYMHKYLKDLCVLDDEKRDKKIAAHRKHEEVRGR